MPALAHVLVVGSINIDLVARVDRLPTGGETVTGGAFERHAGGKSANQAVAAARVGAGVTFIGVVGDDELCREAFDALRADALGRLSEPAGAFLSGFEIPDDAVLAGPPLPRHAA